MTEQSSTFQSGVAQNREPQIEKPEWFAMTEGDQFVPRPRVNRVARMLALATPLLVIGTGFMVAQTSTGQATDLGKSILVASASQNSTVPTTQNSVTVPSQSTQEVGAPVASGIGTSSTTGVRSSIAKPTGGSDDEGVELDD